MKKRKMYVKMITSSILRRKSRMVIALLSIIVGATVVSGLLAIYFDIPRQLSQEFRSYGSNILFVTGKNQETIQKADLKKIEEILSEEDPTGISGFRYETVRMNEIPFTFSGTQLSQVQKTNPYWYIEGDWPDKKNEVLVGQEVADLFLLKEGTTYEITGETVDGTGITQKVKVVGILQTGGSEEEIMYGDLSILENLFPSTESGYDVIEASLPLKQAQLINAGKAVKQETNERVGYQIVKKLTDSEDSVSQKLTLLIFLVTLIVLLITLICVGTTMMSVVQERRKEIGLKKAMGAENKQIVQDFFGEGCMLGLCGGIMGIIFGYIFARIVSVQVFSRMISFHIGLIPITIALALFITLLASLIPVRSAIKVDPALVLKGE